MKYSTNGGSEGETLYFNKMWSWRYNGSQYDMAGQNSKHIYLGGTRIVTKVFRADGSFGEEKHRQYYYHSDHLGSAQLITNADGAEYERLEYTPYGEVWTEKVDASASRMDIPYRFTGKEQDEETGLYYYGARYQDPKTSRWLSADPTLGEYIPGAPVNDQVRKRNGNLPGMGGIYNTVNMHLYHYAGNNPVKYYDPDGRQTIVLPWMRMMSLMRGDLRSVQDTVRNDRMYWPGGGGRYPDSLFRLGMLGPDTTFCNQATFDVADSLGFNQTALYGSSNRDNVNANAAARNLASAAKNGLITEVGGKQAQALANQGYVVIGAWENPTGESGHITTVYPSSGEYNPANGPVLSNVGSEMGIKSTKDVFEDVSSYNNDVKFYYDPNQSFKYDPSLAAQRQE